MKLSTNVKIRDRSCKIVQYSCQMLLGFYATKMSKDTRDMLCLTKYTTSTARKAFWMFKSLNHLQILVDLIDSKKLSVKYEDLGLHLIELVEQFYYILYHWWETLVYLARCKIIDPSQEDAVNRQLCDSWFISDVFGLAAAFIKIVKQVNHVYKRYRQLSLEHTALVENGKIVSSTGMVISPEGQRGFVVAPYKAILTDRSLMAPMVDKSFDLIIAGFEAAVSADFCNLWKTLTGAGMGDGYVGFCGAASSVLLIIQTTNQYARDYEHDGK
jgi:hypothetical protein